MSITVDENKETGTLVYSTDWSNLAAVVREHGEVCFGRFIWTASPSVRAEFRSGRDHSTRYYKTHARADRAARRYLEGR